MNYNIIAYLIFFLLIAFIVIKVGLICYDNGNIFVAELIPNHVELCQQINKVLLVAYYLLNLGYSAMTLIFWETISSLQMLVEVLALKSAIIIGLLSLLHYLNIFILTNYIQKLIK